MCNQWAPKVARKCGSKHWYTCGADGRSRRRSVGRCTVTYLPDFLGWVDYFIFLPMVLSWRASRTRASLIYFTWDGFGEVNVMKIVNENVVQQGFCLQM